MTEESLSPDYVVKGCIFAKIISNILLIKSYEAN